MVAFDHVAIEVADLDTVVEFLTGTAAMRLIRHGVRTATGQRIAMLTDTRGQKLELVEGGDGPPTLLHLAFDVPTAGEVETTFTDWIAAGCESLRAPHVLAVAKATTALVQGPGELELQVIHYDPDSPDHTRGDPP